MFRVVELYGDVDQLFSREFGWSDRVANDEYACGVTFRD